MYVFKELKSWYAGWSAVHFFIWGNKSYFSYIQKDAPMVKMCIAHFTGGKISFNFAFDFQRKAISNNTFNTHTQEIEGCAQSAVRLCSYRPMHGGLSRSLCKVTSSQVSTRVFFNNEQRENRTSPAPIINKACVYDLRWRHHQVLYSLGSLSRLPVRVKPAILPRSAHILLSLGIRCLPWQAKEMVQQPLVFFVIVISCTWWYEVRDK